MRHLYFTWILIAAGILSCATHINSQTILTGRLLGGEAELPLSFATMIAYSLPDSSMAANATTDLDGYFWLRVSDGNYGLKGSFLGYDDLRLTDVKVAGEDTLDLGNLMMRESGISLGLVEVEAERSQMQLKLDKRVFNVGKDLTGAGNSAADILNNVPSVTVDPEGNVSLRGSQGVRILVDGKPSALLSSGDVDALQRMQGDIIESVEVITNPSARYEAEGEAGIINIVLKKEKKRGVNGSFGANLGWPEQFGASYNFNYRRENFNFFSNFGLSYRNSPGGGNSFQRSLNEDGTLNSAFSSETDRDRSGLGGDLQIGTDWYINDRNVLTGSMLFRRSNDETVSTVIYQDLDADDNVLARTDRVGIEESNNRNVEGSLTYKRTFDREDREWTVDLKYILDDDIELTDFEEDRNTLEEAILQNASNTEYETNFLFQTDYVHPLSDSSKIEFGARSMLRTIRNAFFVKEADEDGNFVTLPEFDDELRYSEDIYAAYFIGSWEFGPLGLQAGLRGELSDIGADLLKSGQSSPQDYFSLFPSASLSYQFSPENQLQLSYSRRLSRPDFRSLLPFSNYNDPRNNLEGNPGLRPEFTDSWEAGLLRYLPQGSLLLSAYYRRTNGVIERIFLVDDDGNTLRYPVNLGTRDAYGLEASLSYEIKKWWQLSSDVNLFRAAVDGSFEEVDYSTDITSLTGRINNRFDVGKAFQLQLNFFYEAPRNTPQGRDLSLYSLDIGASLDVMRGKGTFTLSGRDIFNTRIRTSIIDLPDFRSERAFQWRRAQQIVLSFVYRLNQDKR